MANYLDFLLALDAFTRASSRGYVPQGHDMHRIASEAGLVSQGDFKTAARWVGELVYCGYLDHGPPSLGDRHPMPPGTMWTDFELQRVNDYRLTAAGREAADRERRLRREQSTDAALGLMMPDLLRPWMTDEQQRAIGGG